MDKIYRDYMEQYWQKKTTLRVTKHSAITAASETRETALKAWNTKLQDLQKEKQQIIKTSEDAIRAANKIFDDANIALEKEKVEQEKEAEKRTGVKAKEVDRKMLLGTTFKGTQTNKQKQGITLWGH